MENKRKIRDSGGKSWSENVKILTDSIMGTIDITLIGILYNIAHIAKMAGTIDNRIRHVFQ